MSQIVYIEALVKIRVPVYLADAQSRDLKTLVINEYDETDEVTCLAVNSVTDENGDAVDLHDYEGSFVDDQIDELKERMGVAS